MMVYSYTSGSMPTLGPPVPQALSCARVPGGDLRVPVDLVRPAAGAVLQAGHKPRPWHTPTLPRSPRTSIRCASGEWGLHAWLQPLVLVHLRLVREGWRLKPHLHHDAKPGAHLVPLRGP